MTLVKFGHPVKRNGLNPLFTDVFESVFNDSFATRSLAKTPAVNIAETANEFHIELAAPGLKKDDFKIALEKNVLSVSVEKAIETADDTKKYNKREYSFNSFVRSFTLPESADHAKIDAAYEDGVLNITVAKKEESKEVTREITIR